MEEHNVLCLKRSVARSAIFGLLGFAAERWQRAGDVSAYKLIIFNVLKLLIA